MDQLKLEEVNPEVREEKAIQMLKEGFMKTDPLIPDSFVLEYNGGDVVTVFGEELAQNSFDPEFAIDVNELGDGYGEFLKASLGIAPNSKEEIEDYYSWKKMIVDWDTTREVLDKYPYKAQVKGITDTVEFKTADPWLQHEILDYVGQRINMFTKADPLMLNPDFLELLHDQKFDPDKSIRNNYYGARSRYYKSISDYTPEQRAEKIKALKNRSLDFSAIISYEDASGVKYLGPTEIPNSKVIKAFEHRYKRMNEPVTMYASAPFSLSAYYGAVDTTPKQFMKQMVRLTPSVVDSLSEFLEDSEALSDFVQIDIARMLVASTFDETTVMPDYILAMNKKEFVSLVRKIVKEESKDAVQ